MKRDTKNGKKERKEIGKRCFLRAAKTQNAGTPLVPCHYEDFDGHGTTSHRAFTGFMDIPSCKFVKGEEGTTKPNPKRKRKHSGPHVPDLAITFFIHKYIIFQSPIKI